VEGQSKAKNTRTRDRKLHKTTPNAEAGNGRQKSHRSEREWTSEMYYLTKTIK